jgi:hypothetical protein
MATEVVEILVAKFLAHPLILSHLLAQCLVFQKDLCPLLVALLLEFFLLLHHLPTVKKILD